MAFVIPTKTYEKPASGQYHGVLADIVDLGMVTTTFNNQTKTQPMVRFVWILDVNGKDGKPLQVQQRFNVTSLHEKSNVYKVLKQIIGAPPQPNMDIETLIGQTRYLWINTEAKPDGKEFANIMGILPPQAGKVVPVPADYVRAKFRPQTTAGPQGQPVQTYQQPPAGYTAPQTVTAPQATTAAPAGFQPLSQGSDIKF
jgi:hypothetical protein